MLMSSGKAAMHDHHSKADTLLRGGRSYAALSQLSLVPPESLDVYTDFIAWADLAVPAYILSGRPDALEGDLMMFGAASKVSSIHDLPANILCSWVLILQEEGRNNCMRTLLERWITNVYNKAMTANSSGSSSTTTPHLPIQPSLGYSSTVPAAAHDLAFVDYSDEHDYADQPHPTIGDCPWHPQTTLTGVRKPLQKHEMEALARLYVEDCLVGSFDAYEFAANWLDGPMGRVFVSDELTHCKMLHAMLQLMPDGPSFAKGLKERKERNARLLMANTLGSSAIPVFDRPSRNANTAEGGVPDDSNELASVNAAAAESAPAAQVIAAQLPILTSSVLLPFNPLLQRLAVPAATVQAWLKALPGVFLTSYPSAFRSISAPGYTNTARPIVSERRISISDDGVGTSSSATQRSTEQTTDSVQNKPDASAAVSGTGPSPQANPVSEIGGFRFESMAKWMFGVSLAAGLLVYALKKTRLKF